jgi:ABC-type branched-subunit amino acid transport system permease subunit
MMGIAVSGVLFAAYAIAFNIIFGSTGQLFLCVGALAGIGGYTSVIMSDQLGLPLLVTMGAGTLLAALFGASFSWIAVRRSLDVIFVGIVTLAFSLAFDQFILGQRDLTGGETGLRVKTGADTFLREQVPPYYLFVGLIVTYLIIYLVLHRSHLGWAFRALRDDEEAAELAGVNVARYRIYGGVIGSAMLGLAGALYAHVEGFIGPSTFSFGSVDIRVLVMLAFGGIGTMIGPVIGAATFTVLDELLAGFIQLRVVIYGSLIVAIFLGFKRGVVATVASWWQRK